MVRTLSADLIREKNKQIGGPWYVLLEIQVEVTTAHTLLVRLASSDVEVTFEGDTWQPAAFSVGPVEYDAEGTLTEATISVQNVTREAGRLVHLGSGLSGRQVRVLLVHSAWLGTGDKLEDTFEISAVTINETSVGLRLAREQVLQDEWPGDSVNRTRCRWRYKSTDCGAQSPSYSTCPKTLSACIERGIDEFTVGLRPKLHPRRYGGTPGVPGEQR